MTTLAFTGHRPDKLGGYGAHVSERLVRLARECLETFEPETVISGMALGWDQAAAQAAIDLGIPFIAAIPFEGQANRWPAESWRRWLDLKSRAHEIVIVADLLKVDFATATDRRNRWMVDRSDIVSALWNGTPSGTGNCVRYAKQQGKTLINLWTRWQQIKSAGRYDHLVH